MKTKSTSDVSINTYAAIVFLIALAITLRFIALPFTNVDTDGYVKWYSYIAKRGIEAFEDEFSVYTPPYLYLLWVARYFKDSIPAEVAIKLIPISFDLLSAFMIYKIALTHLNRNLSILAAAGFLCLPTIVANSSYWGQIDSVYTSFLLASFYFILQKKSFWAVLFFGTAFSIKVQAVFFLPLLGILFLQKKIRWYHFLLIPAIYIIAGLPSMYVGRSLKSILMVYFNQASEFAELSKNAPNLYIFIPPTNYHPMVEIGFFIFIIAISAWAWMSFKTTRISSNTQLLLTALASLSLVPFLLPKMHDRYFYPTDVFSYVTALFIPKFWFLPILSQLSSGLAYSVFLFNAPPIVVHLATIINTILVILIVYIQLRSLSINAEA